MFGLDFVEANNSIVCGHAEFIIRKREGSDQRFRIGFNPERMFLEQEKWGEREWKTVCRSAKPADIEAILPTGFGVCWTFAMFMQALTFWGEGFKVGCDKGREEERLVNMAREKK